MLIDWFTVGAQIVNFLILVWLLKHFLYKPILDAIDAREKKIAAELADAERREPRQKRSAPILKTRTKHLTNSGLLLLPKLPMKRRPNASASSIKPKRMRMVCGQARWMPCAAITFGWAVRLPFWPRKRSLQLRERHSRTWPPLVLKSELEKYSHAVCGNLIRSQKSC